MSFDWQDLVALSLVAWACGYLLRQGWRLFGRKQPPGGCGSGCTKCPGGSAVKEPVLHQLDMGERKY